MGHSKPNAATAAFTSCCVPGARQQRAVERARAARRPARRLLAVAAATLVTLGGLAGPALAAPTVTTADPGAVRSDRAVLGGTINPNGDPTTYHVEYGTTTAYGAQRPATADADAGSGTDPVLLSQVITGLQPDTTYHYRLVASGGGTPTAGPDRQVRTAPAPIPSDRAYEQISPTEKHGYSVDPFFAGFPSTAISAGGDRAIFASFGAYTGSNTSMPNSYRANRTAAGWVSKSVSPPQVDPDAGIFTETNLWFAFSADLSTGVFDTSSALDPTDVNGGPDIYAVDGTDASSLVTRGTGGERVQPSDPPRNLSLPATVAPDGSAVLFAGTSDLVPGSGRYDGTSQLFERRGSVTRLVGLDNDGELVSRCGTTLGSRIAAGGTRSNAISPDGRQVVFSAPAEGGSGAGPDCDLPRQVYLRADDATTLHVSASQRATPDPAGTQPAAYTGASRDGGQIFFTSTEMLTDDAPAGGGLYVYRVADHQLDLQLVAADYPYGLNVLRNSDDGSHQFFWTYDPVTFAQVLYARSPAGVHPVAEVDVAVASGDYENQALRVSADGRTVLFVSSLNATGADGGGMPQAYVAREGQAVECLSCPPSGQRASESAGAFGMSSSGTIAFDTKAALLPGDQNTASDVYEWRAGRLTLVSAGAAAADARFIDIDDEGRNLMFGTADGLVAQDRDGLLDVYDARIGGGFPDGSDSVVADCDGDACQPATAAAPQGPGPASASAGEPSVPAPKVRLSFATSGLSAKQRAALARRNRATLMVQVTGKGRVTVSGRARVGGRLVTVIAAAKSAAKAGSVRVSLALNAAGRRELLRKRRLTVSLRVSVAGVRPIQTRSAPLRLPTTKSTAGDRS